MNPVVCAVDLGASSGRVILARIAVDRVELSEVHRFRNRPEERVVGHGGELRWNAEYILAEVVQGLRLAHANLAAGETIASIGIDSWAVDYGLLDDRNLLVGAPFCYRDERTVASVVKVHDKMPFEDLYRHNGLQFQPFNSIYQLAAEPDEVMQRAKTMLLIPDLLGFWLTGNKVAEVTNASTTGLRNVTTGDWDDAVLDAVGIPADLLPTLVDPGELVGGILPEVASATGISSNTPVIAVASHDTASAVVGVPSTGSGGAFISSGTWSLVGLELPCPILTEPARVANFTNEAGVDGTTRFLRNVMGLWLMDECLEEWFGHRAPSQRSELLYKAARLPHGGPTFDPNDPSLVSPGGITARIRRLLSGGEACSRTELLRSILDSLAEAYAVSLAQLQHLTGRPLHRVHVVGGGARVDLLSRLTARASGFPVVAGPVEATALGNALIQARALGLAPKHLEELRRVVAASDDLIQFAP